jgi:ferrous iron transport protein A
MYNLFAMVTRNQCLLEMKSGIKAKIHQFIGGPKVQEKLEQYGIFPGDTVEVVRIAPFSGPVLLSINGREIALGRTIAAKILIEEIE